MNVNDDVQDVAIFRLLTVIVVLVGIMTVFHVDRVCADVVIYEGIDPGAGPLDPRPNSDAAASAFDAAAGLLGTPYLIDYEDLPLGNFDSIEVAPGVMVTKEGTDADLGGIVEEGYASGDPQIIGYNTTVGGSQFLGVVPIFDIGTVTVTYDFTDPIVAFGTYITGLGTANGFLYIEYQGGDFTSLPVVGSGDGGVLFFGFTDEGMTISAVHLVLREVFGTRDIYGVDDTRYVEPGPTPTEEMAWGRIKALFR